MNNGIDNLIVRIRSSFREIEDVSVVYENTRAVCYDEPYHRLTDEKSIVTIQKSENRFFIRIRCSGEKSAFYALCELNQRLRSCNLCAGEFTFAPSFAVRGFIEGFYGKPWTPAQRLSMIRLMAEHRMNTVFYAPKDDPYHRALWREPYPKKELNDLSSLFSLTKAYYMDLYWCIAPGLSIKYCCPDDFSALMQKTKQVYDLGVRHFGLLLDDIGEDLNDEDDIRAYAEPVNAHIDLIRRYYDSLMDMDSQIRLVVCPTQYHGRGNEYYISKLGQNIPPQVSLFWTGKDICSRELTADEAAVFSVNTNHLPLYWDNYPVNDEAMFREMHLGPIIGRDKDLPHYARGLIANCMEYAECSKIPLCTIADYLWDSNNYDPETSFEFAVREIVGQQSENAFLTFADHLNSSCLHAENSARLIHTLFAFSRAVIRQEQDAADEIKKKYLTDMYSAKEYLKQDIPLCNELRAWAKKYELACELTEKSFLYIEAPTGILREQINGLLERYNSDPTVLINEMVFREVLMERYSI